jgi:hypothetical protein
MNKGARQMAGDGATPKVDYERLMALGSANVEAVVKASEAIIKGIAKLNEELMSFTSARFKEQVEGSRAIAQCSNWSEAFEKQMNLARSATEQYLAEAGKLANLTTEVTMASWAPFQSYLQHGMTELKRQEGPEKKA